MAGNNELERTLWAAADKLRPNIKDLSIYSQESNPTTLRMGKMNLAIRENLKWIAYEF